MVGLSVSAWAVTACGQRDAQTADANKIPSDQSTGWNRPRSAERRDERLAMVDRQIRARGVRDEAVLNALRQVPRHWFMPRGAQSQAYADRPVSIGEDQTISQPYIVALMTASLQLTSNAKVLEVGTGSGYQAAVLAEITPHVYTIEIVEPLGKRAKRTFTQRGYATVKTRIGDGYAGWEEHAPFDAIIVTCAPDHVPPKLIEQLATGGRVCIPVGGRHDLQWLRLIAKKPDGSVATRDLEPVRFVPMTGDAQAGKKNDGA